MALNCCVVPIIPDTLVGETVIAFNVGVGFEGTFDEEEPPPPQDESKNTTTHRNRNLLNLIYINPIWYQCRIIGPSLQIAHVPPFLNDYSTAMYRKVPLPLFA